MRSFFSNLATRLRRDQRGATAVEYGIMVSLIAVVIIVAVTLLGRNLDRHLHPGPVLRQRRHLHGRCRGRRRNLRPVSTALRHCAIGQ